MSLQDQNRKRPGWNPYFVGIAIPLFFFTFRFTAVAALFTLVLLYLCFPLHRSITLIRVASTLVMIALIIPIDFYIRGFHGPIVNDTHGGPRLVPVMYGLTAGPADNSEAILGGCVVSFHDTTWRFVWD